MHLYYLPTIDFPLWPCVGAALVFLVPITIWHELAWQRTLAEYGEVRLEAGAADPWPPEGMHALLGMQPWLLFTLATMLATMTALGIGALVVWPGKLPLFDAPLNYFDRWYVAAMTVAGTAAVVGAVALGIDLARSPWARVARNVRHATHASPSRRQRLFAAALAADPGVPSAQGTPEAAPSSPEAGTSPATPAS